MITGELIQSLCDVYCGVEEDFLYNPNIDRSKTVSLLSITSAWDNPSVLFCYAHRIALFRTILPHIMNEFTLVTHNSDQNITEQYRDIVEHPKVLFWHAQNVLYRHPKLGGVPIGIANRMWPHGNLTIMDHVRSREIQKTKDIYFYFAIGTNYHERQSCFEALVQKGLLFGTQQDFQSYLETLASFKYAICPPGNGVDCHRLWECYYLSVIPIVKRSVFTEKVASVFPCILVDDWNTLDVAHLLETYKEYTVSNKLDLDDIRYCIENRVDYFDV